MNQTRYTTAPAARTTALAARSAHAAAGLAAIARAEAAAPVTAGPGWFDSSWDLQRGLDVQEGLPSDLGLDEWLAVFLK